MPRTVPSNEPPNPGAMTPHKCGRAIHRIADGVVFSITPQAKTSDGDYETSARAACRRAGYEASGNTASYMVLASAKKVAEDMLRGTRHFCRKRRAQNFFGEFLKFWFPNPKKVWIIR